MTRFYFLFYYIFICSQNSMSQDSIYRIKGVIDPLYDNRKVTLIVPIDGKATNIDSTFIKNGTFYFEGKECREKPLTKIVIDSYFSAKSGNKINLFLEQGTIDLKVDPTYNILGYQVQGTPLNDLYQTYQDSSAYYIQKTVDMYKRKEGGSRTETGLNIIPGGALEAVYRQWGVFTMDFKRKNIHNPVGEAVFKEELREFRMYERIWDHHTDSSFNILYEQCRQEVKESPEVLKYIKRRDKDRELERIQLNTLGKKMEDAVLCDTLGNDIHLLDMVGKGEAVLIDLWASWCHPCMTYIPVLKAIHEFGKNNHLKVIGISLDDNIKSWMHAIHKKEIPWQNFRMKDGETFKAFAKKYGVYGIPYFILLDKEGRIRTIPNLPTEEDLKSLE